MRTKIAATAFVLIGAGATTVAALNPPINMQGSDTLFELTADVVNGCPRTDSGQPAPLGITYVGSGSSNGQRNMVKQCLGTVVAPVAQTVSPMSRFINRDNSPTAANDTCQCSGGDNAEGIAFALDGLAVLANTTSAPASCGGVAYTKTITLNQPGPGTYQANSAFDFLRLAYYGIRHDNADSKCKATGTACTSDAACAAVTANDICIGSCNSDARKSLLLNYANFFESPTCAPGSGCAQVRHLWRRDNASGTTDVFNSLIAGGAALTKWCNLDGGSTPGLLNGQVQGGTAKNGFDYQDNDPIRVPCDGTGLGTNGENLCGDAGLGHQGTLGMLLSIYVPETSDVPAAEAYAPLCAAGSFEALPATRTAFTGLCPSGGPNFGGRCFSGVIRTGATFNANCLVARSTTRCPTLVPLGAECRGANLWMRKPNGDLVIDASIPASRTALPVPPAGRFMLGAFFRIHSTVKMANGTRICSEPSATEQIGCLTAGASPCSLGFAGRSAQDITPTAPALLNVGGVANDIPSIQNLVNIGPYPGSPTTYPLARKLYLTTLVGFDATTGQERDMAQCFSNDTFMAPIVPARGFIAMPGTRKARCEDWDEAGCAGATNNACATNPGPTASNPLGIPTNP